MTITDPEVLCILMHIAYGGVQGRGECGSRIMWFHFVEFFNSDLSLTCMHSQPTAQWSLESREMIYLQFSRLPPWSSSSVLDHRSLPPMFESRRGHIWRLFHLWLRFITFGGSLAHLAYHVHKSGRKTSIIIITSSSESFQFGSMSLSMLIVIIDVNIP